MDKTPMGEIEGAKEELARQKARLLEMQKLSETAVAVKRFSPEMLGAGHAKGGTAGNRKQRFEKVPHKTALMASMTLPWKSPWGQEAAQGELRMRPDPARGTT